ncbi:glycosyltransferase family 9 protein [Bdellovibrio svalbardensis]|uniref:Glycosyltransferase family 9 protein n=1 Tax=Bdellovibrio svalbardensis TaxID=2972972 RepID=A0ABT6DMA6_9BACT|nr:glycosyltransferase family 9 protein [Bdellovibrio svalbardensis]MDG0816946.1 glycosyltransferase family 9 protein [Bdellovibrio svalbardensis]
MKILVVSLLRLGDIIQQEPLLRGLREKHPDAEIHVLLNKQFASIERLLSGVVDRYFTFDRESLQRGLGEAEFNILWSYNQLEALVNQLNGQNYDQVLNFTHNKLSAYLIGAVTSPDKRGLYQDNGKFQGLENRWLRYFNDRFSGTQKSLFHYIELLGNSFDIPTPKKALVQTESKKKSKVVLFQCLTSDVKKNWGLDNFQQLKRTIENGLVDYKVSILGASFEREQLSKVFADDDLVICDLVEAKAHLQNAALLVTGDTSIKHLAAQIGTPVVEIAIGSSDPSKTSAFTDASRILTSAVPCAPCNHSQACTQKSHLCADDLSVDQVFAAVWDQLGGEKPKKASQVRDFERAVWSLYLNRGHQEIEPLYLQAAQKFNQETSNLPEILVESKKKAQQLNSWLERAERALPSRESLLAKKAVQSSELAELIMVGQDILRSKQDDAGYFQNFLESLVGRFSHPVQIYDRVHQALEEVRELIEIRNNLTRYLEFLSTEGAYYATGIGQLSIGGFEETRAGLQRTDEQSVLQRRSRELETFE